MAKQEKLIVKGAEIIFFKKEQEDYISLTDIAKVRDNRSEVVIQNWIRTRMTIELLGLWETLYNPNFKHIEFDVFKSQAGLNAFVLSPTHLIPPKLTPQQISYVYANEADVLNVALFGITAKEWRDQNPDLKGNIRDYATINELICLSNMENINAVLINDGVSQTWAQYSYYHFIEDGLYYYIKMMHPMKCY